MNGYVIAFSQLVVLVAVTRAQEHSAELPDGPLVGPQEQPSTVWPSPELQLGQVAGIDLDSNKNVHVFQRGSHVWDGSAFAAGGKYRKQDEGPIPEESLLVLDKYTGEVISARGANRFYMPHGLTVDDEDNVWVTDVALHQVMKFRPGEAEPELVLGKAFTPGSGDDEFCQPTDVAVASNGDFFVSDGYCNARIMKFSPDGRLITQWGTKNTGNEYPAPNGNFRIPHSITLVESWDLLCVADRENQRIQCFSAGVADRHPRHIIPTGTFLKKAEDIGRVYAIDSGNHYLVGVTNRGSAGESPRLFVVDLENGNSEVMDAGLVNPHDVVTDVSDTGDVKTVYVAEIGPNAIRKVEL